MVLGNWWSTLLHCGLGMLQFTVLQISCVLHVAGSGTVTQVKLPHQLFFAFGTVGCLLRHFHHSIVIVCLEGAWTWKLGSIRNWALPIKNQRWQQCARCSFVLAYHAESQLCTWGARIPIPYVSVDILCCWIAIASTVRTVEAEK